MIRTLTAAALLCLAAGAGSAQPVTPEKALPVDECEVIARVDGIVVTACEVLWQVELRIEGKTDGIPPDQLAKIRRTLMQQQLFGMLDMKVLYADFRRTQPEADLAAIHAELDSAFEENEVPSLMRRVGVDDIKELEPRLVEIGTCLRDLREDYYQKQIARSWINNSVTTSREVTHAELLAYYLEHSEDYDYPTQARWEELMVLFRNFDTKAAAYAELAGIGNEAYRAAVAQPDRGEPAFESIAKARSQGFNAADGGRHDWTTKGALTAERVDGALFTLPVGEMSPILESDRGFHIVRVLERREAGRTPFTEVQGEIRKKILDKRLDKAFADKLQELRRDAKIWTVFTGDFDYAAAREQTDAPKRR